MVIVLTQLRVIISIYACPGLVFSYLWGVPGAARAGRYYESSHHLISVVPTLVVVCLSVSPSESSQQAL